MHRFVALAGLAIFSLGVVAAQSRLVLKDGTVVNGTFVSGTSRDIVFRDNNGIQRRFNLNQIQTLDFNSGYMDSNGSGAHGDSRAYDHSGANRSDNRGYANDNRGYNGGSVWETLPAGSEIAVRTNETIDSETATSGRLYSAVIDKDVIGSDGRVAIPRGSDAQLVIRDVSEGGTLKSGNLVLDLDSVRVNGRRYMVSTTDLEQSGERAGIGKNRRTAEMVGGGAALGTLLGAIAGGGKGAVIGAIAGAAAGGTAQVLTKGKEIKVPSETVLNFRLDQPLQLREVR